VVESLEPRLALATGLLSTLVSVVRSNNSQSLLAPGATAGVTEGTELAASVRLTRRPDSAITVSFKSLAPLEVGVPSTPLRFTPANWNQPQSVSFASFQDGSRDGDQLVPVSMTAAVAKTPQAHSSKKIWIESQSPPRAWFKMQLLRNFSEVPDAFTADSFFNFVKDRIQVFKKGCIF
jgi:hypothetical protein